MLRASGLGMGCLLAVRGLILFSNCWFLPIIDVGRILI
jgi:hypothetical protein